ncbi:uncharacterized protein BDW43DRAFT_285961 [Aspergillus alliaceus]|uniref:uncharacterized protein n=1 Tax=Petromyces alliaceus TaxID=209559 RepID=UPI0012A49B51|nr:uncharacterized protein BDW43DRAFT_285961 [Aspergillus alliaceus]KAB8230257.1 hypothetical protein BDW43DRAFT_285961 [Aspergillus alliaceus]
MDLIQLTVPPDPPQRIAGTGHTASRPDAQRSPAGDRYPPPRRDTGRVPADGTMPADSPAPVPAPRRGSPVSMPPACPILVAK